MADRMLQFTHLPQKNPEKRAAGSRKADFDEIYKRFDVQAASAQSSRCSQCGIPFCSIHCPLSNNIPDWLKLTAEGRLEEAYEISSATNTFPEICGRICPQDRLCEGNCVIEKGFESVTIGAVERYITDTAFDQGWVKPITAARELDYSVGIIGAGPAGLAAAESAAAADGYKVTVYDRHDRVGGLLIYGIPGFKLEKSIVTRRTKWADRWRREIRAECRYRRQNELFRIARDAMTPCWSQPVCMRPRELTGPGSGLAGIVPSLDYLITSNRKGLGDRRAGFRFRIAERRRQEGRGGRRAAIRRWIAYAPPSARAPNPSPACTAATR